MMQDPYKETAVDVVGGCKFGRYPKISKSQTWNMYMSDDWLLSFSGWKKVLNVTDISPSSFRGLYPSVRNNILLAVVNNNVYVIDIGFEVTFVGRLTTSVGPVFMDENLSDQIAIVDGLNLYIFNANLNSLTVQDIDKTLILPNYVCYNNTFFLLGNGLKKNNGSKWAILSYESETSVSITATLSIETKPDYALAVIRLPGSSNNVLVFGSTVTEIWTQSAGLQPYIKNTTLSIDYGCLSVSTIASSDRLVMWLAVNENSDPIIMMFTGSDNMTISTDGISTILSYINYPAQSTAYFIRKDGHLFYVLTFYNQADNITFMYDTDTKLFSFLTDGDLNYFPPLNVVYFNGSTYFGSINNASLYKLDSKLTTYDENIGNSTELDDNIIPRIRVCSPSRFATTKRFRARNFTLTIDQGNDNDYPKLGASMSYAPHIDLSWSIDGNQTFGTPTTRPMQYMGIRQNIFKFQGPFGLMNDLSFKVRFFTKSYVATQNATLEVW